MGNLQLWYFDQTLVRLLPHERWMRSTQSSLRDAVSSLFRLWRPLPSFQETAHEKSNSLTWLEEQYSILETNQVATLFWQDCQSLYGSSQIATKCLICMILVYTYISWPSQMFSYYHISLSINECIKASRFSKKFFFSILVPSSGISLYFSYAPFPIFPSFSLSATKELRTTTTHSERDFSQVRISGHTWPQGQICGYDY